MDSAPNSIDIDHETYDLLQRARQNAYVGFWMTGSTLVIGVLAYFGIDIFSQSTGGPAEKLFSLIITIVLTLIMGGMSFWSWTGSRIGAAFVVAFVGLEIWARVAMVLDGNPIGVPILTVILAIFSVSGLFGAFAYQAERKRLRASMATA